MIALLIALAQELTHESYEEVRDHILPDAAELEWMKVGWRPSFWDAVLEAQKTQKPILLWAMNGHPLACT
jgi:hypothetical protein